MAPTKRMSPFLKFGMPLVLFSVAGYYGLSRFVEGKYQAIDQRVKHRSERAVQLEMAHKVRVYFNCEYVACLY